MLRNIIREGADVAVFECWRSSLDKIFLRFSLRFIGWYERYATYRKRRRNSSFTKNRYLLSIIFFLSRRIWHFRIFLNFLLLVKPLIINFVKCYSEVKLLCYKNWIFTVLTDLMVLIQLKFLLFQYNHTYKSRHTKGEPWNSIVKDAAPTYWQDSKTTASAHSYEFWNIKG